MYEINIDKDCYYAEGNDGTLVEIAEMPAVDDVRYLPAYQYDSETQTLVVNQDKLKSIQSQIDSETVDATPTIEERLEAVEGLMLDMLASAEGGD